MAFEFILERSLKKYKLEHLMPDFSKINIESENPAGQATLIEEENDECSFFISSSHGSCPGIIPDGFGDMDVTVMEAGSSEPQQGTSQKTSNKSKLFRIPLPPDESCLDKTSKWLDSHKIDSQTNRLAPPTQDQNNEEGSDDSDDTDSDLEPEKESKSQPEQDRTGIRVNRNNQY